MRLTPNSYNFQNSLHRDINDLFSYSPYWYVWNLIQKAQLKPWSFSTFLPSRFEPISSYFAIKSWIANLILMLCPFHKKLIELWGVLHFWSNILPAIFFHLVFFVYIANLRTKINNCIFIPYVSQQRRHTRFSIKIAVYSDLEQFVTLSRYSCV